MSGTPYSTASAYPARGEAALEHDLHIHTDSIPLSAALKLAGVATSGGQAKVLVRDGRVRVNGVVETRRGARIRPGDVVQVVGSEAWRIVGA